MFNVLPVERTHECRSAGLALRDIPEDSGIELGSGWGPALTSYRDLGRKGQSQDGLHLYLYSSLTLLQIDKYIIVITLKDRGYPLACQLKISKVGIIFFFCNIISSLLTIDCTRYLCRRCKILNYLHLIRKGSIN